MAEIRTRAPEIGLGLEVKVQCPEEVRRLFLPGELGAVLDWEVRDKEGKVVSRGAQKSQSYVRQFLDLLLVKFLDVPACNPMQIRDINNTLVDVSNASIVLATNAAAGDVTMGIIVGTGNTAPTITDYAIQTIIPHDSGAHGAGTMQYGAVTYGAPASDATTSQFTITRNFANATVGAITVNEIALYVKAITPIPWSGAEATQIVRNLMTIRDVIAGGITVAAGQTLTVNYRPQVVL